MATSIRGRGQFSILHFGSYGARVKQSLPAESEMPRHRVEPGDKVNDLLCRRLTPLDGNTIDSHRRSPANPIKRRLGKLPRRPRDLAAAMKMRIVDRPRAISIREACLGRTIESPP